MALMLGSQSEPNTSVTTSGAESWTTEVWDSEHRQVSLIVWGWALAQYPYLVPPDLTIRDAAAPRITLVLILWALVAGGLVLFPSLVYLLRVFKREHAGP